MSLNVVGNPSMPFDSFVIALSESSAETPIDCNTLGNLFNVSNRSIAAPIDFRNVLNAAAPTATNPNDVASFLMLIDALPDSFPTPFTLSSALSTPCPDFLPDSASSSSALDATVTCLSATSI